MKTILNTNKNICDFNTRLFRLVFTEFFLFTLMFFFTPVVLKAQIMKFDSKFSGYNLLENIINNNNISILRFSSTDELDNTFGNSGIVTTGIRYPGNDHAYAVALQNDGKIVVTGYTWDTNLFSDFATVRYNTDGTLDNSFGNNGKVITNITNGDDNPYAIAIQADGKILVAGRAYGYFLIVRYNTNGTLDTLFGINGIVKTQFTNNSSGAYSMSIQANGKIVLAGDTYNSITLGDFALVRYNIDGSLDSTFGTMGKVITTLADSNFYGNSIAIQSDGKLILVGTFLNDFILIRYNINGSLDSSFGTNGKVITDFSGGKDIGKCIAIQADGKIIVAGSSGGDIALARYNPDGNLDNTFGLSGKTIASNSNGDTIDMANGIGIQTGGKIVVAGGAYINYNSESYYHSEVLRFNFDGTLDNNFGTNGEMVTIVGDGYSNYNSIVIQPDDKIVAAGVSFTSSGIYGNDDEFTVVRYNSNLSGENDYSFEESNFLLYPNPAINWIAVEYTLFKDEVMTIGIYDISGKLIKSILSNTKINKGRIKEQIDIRDVQSGIYIVRISSDSLNKYIKIVKL